jgi:drug/metabolite transporter (DMT)-like permease
MIGRDVLARDLLIVACAVSAGIHAALVREHLEEGRPAGVAFAVSAALLAAAAVGLTRRMSPSLLGATAALLVGLILSYLLAVTTGVPVLHPAVEPVEGLALFTKAVELVGVVAAVALLEPAPILAGRPKGTLA